MSVSLRAVLSGVVGAGAAVWSVGVSAQVPASLAVSPVRVSTPLVVAGEPVEIRVQVNNPGSSAVSGVTAAAEVSSDLSLDPPSPEPRTVSAGGSADFRWTVRADRGGVYPLRVHVRSDGGAETDRAISLAVAAGMPSPDTYQDIHPQVRADADGSFTFRNRHLVAVVPHLTGGYGPVLFYPTSRPASVRSRPSAVAPSLGSVTWREGGKLREGTFIATSAQTHGDARLELAGSVRDGTTSWDARAELEIDRDPWIKWTVRVRPAAATALTRFAAMPLRMGQSGPREAIFPGLEYLEGTEESSSNRDDHTPAHDRHVPDPYKVTIPLVSVAQEGSTTALLWDNHQEWGGAGSPAALFDSPNRLEGQENTRVELFLPPVPQFVHENEEEAATPLAVAAGQELRLSGRVCVLRDVPDPARAVREWASAYGTPRAEGLPRTTDAERALCRQAFTRTLWDAQAKGWKRSLGPNSPAPKPYAFDVLALLMDAEMTSSAATRQQLRGQADAVLEILRKQGPLDPRLAYRLEGATASVDAEADRIHELIRTQLATGGWAWNPDDKGEEGLAEPATTDVGTIASKTLRILRYAVLTGDSAAVGSARRALEYVEANFRVPRAGHTDDTPLHAPDLLAATQAAESYLLAYQITGEDRYYRDAHYWADAGMTFVYFWDDKQHPAMKHATVPLLGATRFTQSWFGVAAQPAGLAYARMLRLLSRVRPDGLYDAVSEGILASAMRQQSTAGDTAGLLPEAWSVRENKGHGASLSPGLLLTVMDQGLGHDTDLSHVRARVGPDRLYVASGANIVDTDTTAFRLRLNLRWLDGQDTFTTVGGVVSRPISVQYNSHVVPVLGHSLHRNFLPEVTRETERGWYYDPETELLILRLHHTGHEDHLEIRWPDPRERTPVEQEDIHIRPLK